MPVKKPVGRSPKAKVSSGSHSPRDIGWNQAIESQSATMLAKVGRHQFQLRGSSRSLLTELRHVGVSDFVIRCILLPLVAWADTLMTDASRAKRQILKSTRRIPEGEPKRHVEYAELLLKAPDTLAQMQQYAPTLCDDMMHNVNRDVRKARKNADRDELRESPDMHVIRTQLGQVIDRNRLIRHLCDVMAASTASRSSTHKRYHGLVGQLLVACGLEGHADYESLRLRIRQRDRRASAAPK